ncbi:glycine cleavage system protein GcvH [Chloroflexota bacterium]
MYPPDLKYHSEHTWVRREEGDKSRIGLTFYAQEQLQEIVFVELPLPGSEVVQSEPFGIVESRKIAQDISSPVSGKIIDVNHRLELEPGLINLDPYGEGWMMLVEVDEPSQLDSLMAADRYRSFTGGE